MAHKDIKNLDAKIEKYRLSLPDILADAQLTSAAGPLEAMAGTGSTVEAVNLISYQLQQFPTHSEMVQGLSSCWDAIAPFRVMVKNITVSSAEMLALNATPKQLLGAPGAGMYYDVMAAEFFLDYNSVAYGGIAAGEDLSLRYASAGEILQMETTGFLDQVTDQLRCVKNVNTLIGVNEAINLQLLVGEILNGNSPLKVRLYYRMATAIS